MDAKSYLVGYIYGDGCVSQKQIVLYGIEKDLPRVEAYSKVLGVDLNVRWPSFKKTPVWMINWPQRFRLLLGDMSGQRVGILPEGLDVVSLLAGLWDADGCVYSWVGNGYLQGDVNFASSKRTLREGVASLLRELGFDPTLCSGMNHRGEVYGKVHLVKKDWAKFAGLVSLQEPKAKALLGLL